MSTIIANGTIVQITSIDFKGYQGRSLHPLKKDEGKYGIIYETHMFYGDEFQNDCFYIIQLFNEYRKLEVVETEILKIPLH